MKRIDVIELSVDDLQELMAQAVYVHRTGALTSPDHF